MEGKKPQPSNSAVNTDMTMPDCQVCRINQSKYSCSRCSVVFCSLPCYNHHNNKDHHQHSPQPTGRPAPPAANENIPDKSLRSLASLNWPYAPDHSAYPDPLNRDDPKILQLHQYEAIGLSSLLRSVLTFDAGCTPATSTAIREVLTSYPSLKEVLVSIDKLRGQEREEAFQTALGITASDADRHGDLSENSLALRKLAEAVEAAVRGDNQSALGLDWGDALE